jgi:hypothetical protein
MDRMIAPPAAGTHGVCRTRSAAMLVAMALLVGVLSGCAVPRKPSTDITARELPEAFGQTTIAVWQDRLDRYLATAGGGDPAALARLPALRSSAVLRPGQIVFAATDVDAFTAERDGFDVFGLLVGKQDTASGPRYVFIVAIVERQEYWPLGVRDVRVAALSIHHGAARWETGAANGEALARYLRAADTEATVRFPTEADSFRLSTCEPGVCVEELRSGARWALYSGALAAPGAAPRSDSAATTAR